MSKLWKPTKLTPRQQNLQTVNTYVNVHDLTCNCNEPLKHIIQQITEQEPSIKKETWFTTTDNGENPGGVGDVDDFGEGELEALFAEPEEKEG